jgi:hypothetical protein
MMFGSSPTKACTASSEVSLNARSLTGSCWVYAFTSRVELFKGIEQVELARRRDEMENFRRVAFVNAELRQRPRSSAFVESLEIVVEHVKPRDVATIVELVALHPEGLEIGGNEKMFLHSIRIRPELKEIMWVVERDPDLHNPWHSYCKGRATTRHYALKSLLRVLPTIAGFAVGGGVAWIVLDYDAAARIETQLQPLLATGRLRG